ncbi:Thioredoxin-like fold [Tylopilus felleus]
MFSAFSRRLPQISIFHHPSSPPSVKALAMLRASLSAPYPPTKPDAPPLDFNLEVIESKPPTPEQLRAILSYVTKEGSGTAASQSYATFLSSHPSAPGTGEEPQNATGVAELGTRNPNALKWPVVVDWNGGRASVGDVDGVAKMLETLRQRRDGEVKKEDVVEPKGWFW